MVETIEFTHERFKKEDDYNVLAELTDNTIIICNNYKLMDTLAKEILDTINGRAEHNNYDCNDADCRMAKIVLNFGLQRIIDINGQRITLALEPSIIYKANKPEDVWFFDSSDYYSNTKYEEYIYPLSIFKGYLSDWNEGLDEVYKNICNGRYGTYDGNWVDHSKYNIM